MPVETIIFKDLGTMPYKEAWDYQEKLLQKNVLEKSAAVSSNSPERGPSAKTTPKGSFGETTNFLLFVEHPPVYTLGKSGKIDNVLLSDDELSNRDIEFYHTNRGGDVTYHGPGQIVGYPILDLERFGTDIGKYLRNIEEVIILTLADHGIHAERSPGETGVWIEPGIKGKERKICAIGVRCSRWITMHGFALNVNTDLGYFNNIIPCGIQNKKVTSIQNELGTLTDISEIKKDLLKNFEIVFNARMITDKEETYVSKLSANSTG
jgi:lipoyl(octanoyl) transferase